MGQDRRRQSDPTSDAHRPHLAGAKRSLRYCMCVCVCARAWTTTTNPDRLTLRPRWTLLDAPVGEYPSLVAGGSCPLAPCDSGCARRSGPPSTLGGMRFFFSCASQRQHEGSGHPQPNHGITVFGGGKQQI